MMIEDLAANQLIPERVVLFSVCTLVTNWEEYKTMVDSYKKASFSDEICEFLYINNTQGNQYDAYTGLNQLMAKASGQYIILSHQDTEAIYDDAEQLQRCIREINQIDPRWAVLANAGSADIKRLYKRISHPHDTWNTGPFPQRVNAVDENFILLKKAAHLSFSPDLTGFHFYGTDICLVAEQKEFTCYVIDFHLLHKSTGTLNESFFTARRAFIKKYSRNLSARYIRTTCTIMFISKNPFLNFLMNQPFMVTFAKFVKKVELGYKRIKY